VRHTRDVILAFVVTFVVSAVAWLCAAILGIGAGIAGTIAAVASAPSPHPLGDAWLVLLAGMSLTGSVGGAALLGGASGRGVRVKAALVFALLLGPGVASVIVLQDRAGQSARVAARARLEDEQRAANAARRADEEAERERREAIGKVDQAAAEARAVAEAQSVAASSSRRWRSRHSKDTDR
jgi:hypothetical protein